MPGARDSNQRRPPRRPSWQDPDESADGQAQSEIYARPEPDFDTNIRAEGAGSRSIRKPTSSYSGNGKSNSKDFSKTGGKNASPTARSAFQNQGNDNDDDDDDDEQYSKQKLSKKNRKRLLTLLGNEALCLLIIFSMINAFNWMATDYSGDYMGRDRQLGTVTMAITRRATTVDGELSYNAVGFLATDPDQDQPAPPPGKPLTLVFVTPNKWHGLNTKSRKAQFKGKIEGGTATGIISDFTGQHKVSLEKNVLTSLFSQMRSHVPQIPSMPLPSLFNEKEKPIRTVMPIGAKGSNAAGNRTFQTQTQKQTQKQTQTNESGPAPQRQPPQWH